MRIRTAAVLGVVAVTLIIGFLSVQSSQGQDGQATGAVDRLYDRQAHYDFEQSLDETQAVRLVRLVSRFALADPALPLPELNPTQPFYVRFRSPMRAEFARQMMEAGAAFVGYAPYDTHFVRARDAQSLAAIGQLLRAEPSVAGTLLRSPADACTEEAWKKLHGPDFESADFRILFWADVSPAQVLGLIARPGVTLVEASRTREGEIDFETRYMDVRLSRATAIALSADPLLEAIELSHPLQSHNVASQALVSASANLVGPATPYNLTGDGLVAGVWDAARARDTHVDYQGAGANSPINNGGSRVLKVDGTSLNTHSGHVAGTIMGDGTGNAAARGFAPKAYVVSHNWTNVPPERRDARHFWRIVADNHSYGSGGAPAAGYDSSAQTADTDIRDLMIKECRSAGNDGSGDRTITADAGSKNSFIIGAAEDNGNIASFSSRGPTDDGRVLPHFMLNGVGLLSTYTGSDTAYASISGTSMSSPSMCGSMVLLSELYMRENSRREFYTDVAKAVLAATTTDAYNTGPDYRFGYGLVNVKRAADLILADKASGGRHIVRGAVRPNTTMEWPLEVTSSAEPLRVVMSWLDVHASTSASIKLVNDLDLELVEPNGTTIHHPYSGLTTPTGAQTFQFTNTGPNRRDNTEWTLVNNPTVGTWKVRVRGFSVPSVPQPTVLNDAVGFVIACERPLTITKESQEDTLNTSAAVPIPDNSAVGVTRTFVLTDTRPLLAVRLYLDVWHTARGDLTVTLKHPDNTSVILEGPDTSTRDDIIAVFPDTRQYDNDVAVMLGKPAAGTWTVTITDTLPNNTGELRYLALEVDLDGSVPANAPPVAHAGSSQAVNEGVLVNLTAAASTDPENDPMTFLWTQVLGPSVTITNASSMNASFTAPQVGATTILRFRVTVSDNQSNSSFSECLVYVFDTSSLNQLPNADAGADFGVAEGLQGGLSGVASTDPDMDALTYAWTQLTGPPTPLTGANTVSPTFTAPQVPATTTVMFRLTVNDGRGGLDTDDIVVTIVDVPPNNSPDADAGPDQDVMTGAAVALSALASTDPDGDPLTYQWFQVSGTATVTLNNANSATPDFVAPGAADTLVFQVEVDDGQGSTDIDTVTIQVDEPPPAPPPTFTTPAKARGGGGGCAAGATIVPWFVPLALIWRRRRQA